MTARPAAVKIRGRRRGVDAPAGISDPPRVVAGLPFQGETQPAAGLWRCLVHAPNGSFYMVKTADDIDAHIGSRVRLRRLTAGVSQEQLGAALGVTFQQVQKYEKGTNRIGAARLYRISRILHVPVSYFYEGLGHANGSAVNGAEGADADRNGAEIVEFIATPEGYALNRAFSRIEDGATRRRLVDLVRTIAQAGGR